MDYLNKAAGQYDPYRQHHHCETLPSLLYA